MKILKLILTLATIGLSQMLEAQTAKRSSSSDVVVCKNVMGQVTSIEPYVFYQTRVLRGIPLDQVSGTPEEILSTRLKKVSFGPITKQELKDSLDRFSGDTLFIRNVHLIGLQNTKLATPQGCAVETVLNLTQRHFGDEKSYVVDLDLWERMDAQGQAAVMLEAVLYRRSQEKSISHDSLVQYLSGIFLASQKDLWSLKNLHLVVPDKYFLKEVSVGPLVGLDCLGFEAALGPTLGYGEQPCYIQNGGELSLQLQGKPVTLSLKKGSAIFLANDFSRLVSGRIADLEFEGQRHPVDYFIVGDDSTSIREIGLDQHHSKGLCLWVGVQGNICFSRVHFRDAMTIRGGAYPPNTISLGLLIVGGQKAEFSDRIWPLGVEFDSSGYVIKGLLAKELIQEFKGTKIIIKGDRRIYHPLPQMFPSDPLTAGCLNITGQFHNKQDGIVLDVSYNSVTNEIRVAGNTEHFSKPILFSNIKCTKDTVELSQSTVFTKLPFGLFEFNFSGANLKLQMRRI